VVERGREVRNDGEDGRGGRGKRATTRQPTTARQDNQPMMAQKGHGVKMRRGWREMRGGEAGQHDN